MLGAKRAPRLQQGLDFLVKTGRKQGKTGENRENRGNQVILELA